MPISVVTSVVTSDYGMKNTYMGLGSRKRVDNGHQHEVSTKTENVPSGSDFLELQKTISAKSTELSEFSRKTQTVIASIQEGMKELMTGQKDFEKTLNTTIEQQLSDGSPFFTKFSAMAKGHIDKVQALVVTIQAIAQKTEGLSTELVTKATEVNTKCETAKKDIEMHVSAVKLEVNNGIAAVKKITKDGEDSLTVFVQQGITNLGLLIDAFQKDYQSIKSSMDSQVKTVTETGKTVDEQITTAGKIFSNLDAARIETETLLTAINDQKEEMQKLNAGRLQLTTQVNELERQILDLAVKHEKELAALAAHYNVMIVESKSRLDKIDGSIARSLAKHGEIISAYEMFKSSQNSFLGRIKWALFRRF